MSSPLFRIPSKELENLEQQGVSNGLDTKQVPVGLKERLGLSNEAEVTIKRKGSEWLIVDPKRGENPPTLKAYRIKLEGAWWKSLRRTWKSLLVKLKEIWRTLARIFWREKLSVYELLDEDRGTITPDLADAFEKERGDSPQHYNIQVEREGSEWLIADLDGQQARLYRAVKDGEEFEIWDLREDRAYKTTRVPTLKNKWPQSGAGQVEMLTKLYSEICSSWRQLTEVRFKLLGFVPAVSVAILISLLSRARPGEGLSPEAQMLVAIFGLFIILALYIYERRNSELYDDLISRGRKIEEELGISTGQFLGRRKPASKLFFVLTIQHDTAIKVIYWTAIVGWLLALIYIRYGKFPWPKKI